MTPSSVPTYPITLDLSGRRCLVVGGGPVAARRVRGLVDSGAIVEVVTPWLCEELSSLLALGLIRWHAREYVDGDVDGMWIVHTATGDVDVDAAVASACDWSRIWCVRADSAGDSRAWTPASARAADGVIVAVSGGGDPGRARAIRDAIAASLDNGQLPVRRTRLSKTEQHCVGVVHLVGGGPGHPDLITTRGRRLLALADVVVVDRLAPTELLDELADDVIVVDVGKTPGHHTMTQEQINDVLVHHALLGRDVVRLKGGDPFVLGRGGEELLACRRAGVSVDVVPGVTSAVSVPAAAGIPVTHRGIASSFAVISAHDGIDAISETVSGLPATTTLVMLMGVRLLCESADVLMSSGRGPSTPVAIIESGWTEHQRTTVGTLANIATLAKQSDIQSPAVIVVGDVVHAINDPHVVSDLEFASA